MFFNKATSNIKPISNNEAKRGFSHGDRYEQLYPGVYDRRYEMRSVVPSGRPLKFKSASEFTNRFNITSSFIKEHSFNYWILVKYIFS